MRHVLPALVLALATLAPAGCGRDDQRPLYLDQAVWTTGGHRYAIGFHDFHGFAHTLRLDVDLARGVRLVGARGLRRR